MDHNTLRSRSITRLDCTAPNVLVCTLCTRYTDKTVEVEDGRQYSSRLCLECCRQIAKLAGLT